MNPASKPFHQLVWIDHQTAHLYGVTRDALIELAVIHAPDEGRGHVHHKAGTMGPGHVAAPQSFLNQVATALLDAREILIVGPADAKHSLKKHIVLNMPLLDKRVIGVKPMDKCGVGELQVFASQFFRQTDRMQPSPS